MDFDVVGLGQCCLDYLALADNYPLENMKQEYSELLIQGGGPVATALVCLARLGRRTAFIGRVGEDRFGPVIKAGLVREGVGVEALAVTTGRSQFSFILVNSDRATRTIFWRRGDGRLLGEEEVDSGLIRSSGVLLLDGLFEAAGLKAARVAREAGVEVVMDMGKVRARSFELAALADHLIVSQVFAEEFAPGESVGDQVRRLHALGPKVAIVTLGSKGSVGYDGHRMISQPSFPVAAFDTTGAGDVYHGAYIQALLEGLDLAGRMRFGSAVAALAVTELGGRTGLPDQEQAKAFLADQAGVARAVID